MTKLSKYRIEGWGCPIGRLNTCIKDRFVREVEAATPAEARLKAYETHEHIPGGADSVRAVLLEEKGEDSETS